MSPEYSFRITIAARIPLVVSLLSFAPSAGAPTFAGEPGSGVRAQSEYSSISMDDLLAWCIVPFDSRDRSPEERIEMLLELGFRNYAYDWRTRHLSETARELRLAEESGIRVAAVWIWVDAGLDRPGRLSSDNNRILAALEETGISTQLWVGFEEDYFHGLSEEESIERAARMIDYLCQRARQTASRVALYNHGGWFGEPENQIKIIRSLPTREVGIVYNFHHGHEHIGRFEELAEAMAPYLWAVNLNGMRPEGPKILPFGQGSHERWMLQTILDTGFKGPFGILGHVEDADVRLVLRTNLKGLLAEEFRESR